MGNMMQKKMVADTGTNITINGDALASDRSDDGRGVVSGDILLKPLEYVGNCLLGLCCASVCLLFILMLVGIIPRIVISGSMEPEIMTGSLTFINTNNSIADVEMGDIIAYKVDDKLQVAHRVVDITPEGLRTKGDRNDEVDSLVITGNNFMGKVVFSIPLLGYVFAFLKTPIGIVLTLSFMVILCIALHIYRKIKYV